MKKQSAGILLFKQENNQLTVFLVHPGGPFWKNKNNGSWTIPKGEFDQDESALSAAIREFKEETGAVIEGNFIPLRPIVQKGGKQVHAWALTGNIDETKIISNEFELEWPPGSGKLSRFPEVDRAAWFTIPDAREAINPAQVPLLEELAELVKG